MGHKMQYKNKKIQAALTALLLGIMALSAISIGVAASRISEGFEVSVLGGGSNGNGAGSGSAKKILTRHKIHLRSAGLIAQLAVPDTILNPLTICVYEAPENPEYKGEFISQTAEINVLPGEEFEVSLYIKNTGNTTWFGDSAGCSSQPLIRLGTARKRDRNSVFYNPADPRWVAQNRIAMTEERVEPDEIATFKFSSRAPDVTDIFREYFQPVVEAKQWIENKTATAHADIYVGENGENQESRLFYLGVSGQASALDITGEPVIDIDISEQKLRFKFGNTVVREYTVSTGTFKTPTPLGRFKILNKQELRIGSARPHYRMPFWQGFTKWGHGLHALPYLANDNGVFWNEALDHIGQRVSHGCVRMLNEDAEDLYQLTSVGMALVVHD